LQESDSVDPCNSFYHESPGPPRKFQYTGRFRVVDPTGVVLQVGYNCRWFWLQGELIVQSRETGNTLNQWPDPSEQLRVIPWPEQVYSHEEWD
jgi:hypothetical protein